MYCEIFAKIILAKTMAGGVLQMSKMVIQGGTKLSGSVSVHGAKNAVLPILAATLLTRDVSIIKNCPDLLDVRNTIEILSHLGAKVARKGDTLTIDTKNADGTHIPEALMRKMRSSIIFMGAILARNGYAKISAPGGCELGPRPIDLHIKALKDLKADITEAHGYIICKGDNLSSGNIYLKFPSVGATENIMLAACLNAGKTVISNVAKEPEICDLADFLNKMGAKISGAGSSEIEIEGVSQLTGSTHSVMPDRIVAATYLCAAAATGSNITLKNVVSDHISSAIHILHDMGCIIETTPSSVHIVSPKKLIAPEEIKTMPYPGFPTDMQSQFLSALTLAEGTSIITENIFESRFRHAEELNRMGADIKIVGRSAIIKGIDKLSAANVTAHDLRGAAALVIAALSADGKTVIDEIDYLDRGYENFAENLNKLGAKIYRTY